MRSEGQSSQKRVSDSLAAIGADSDINAFLGVRADEATREAMACDAQRTAGGSLGPLHGVTLAIKDNIQVAGLPCTGGTPALRSCIAEQDAGVITRLKAAGAIVIGKSNMHELAFGITSDNEAFGAVHNARRYAHIAGGSSGGTAAAIASGMVMAGLGTDTGGSCRIPAALNGIVGFRPTSGRYPSDGLIRISHTRDTVGPMASTVADVSTLDAVLTQDIAPDDTVNLEDLRLGVPRSYFYSDLEPEVAEGMAQTLDRLADAGVTLMDVELPGIDSLNEKIGFPLVLYEARQLLEDYLANNCPEVQLEALVAGVASPDVRQVMDAVLRGDISSEAYTQALDTHRPVLQEMYRDCFRQHRLDALVFPTTPLTARPIAGSRDCIDLNGRRAPTFLTYIRNTDPGSNAGIPGISLPAPVDAGAMPVGIELDGPEYSDRRLLAIGIAIERLLAEGNPGHASI